MGHASEPFRLFDVLSGWNEWVEADVGGRADSALFGLVRLWPVASTLSIGAEHRLIKEIECGLHVDRCRDESLPPRARQSPPCLQQRKWIADYPLKTSRSPFLMASPEKLCTCVPQSW